MWGKLCFKQFEKFCSRQWKLKIVSNITFFCNKFRSTIKLTLIMDKYSIVVNGVPKESNTKRV